MNWKEAGMLYYGVKLCLFLLAFCFPIYVLDFLADGELGIYDPANPLPEELWYVNVIWGIFSVVYIVKFIVKRIRG